MIKNTYIYIAALLVSLIMPSLHLDCAGQSNDLGLKTVVIDPGHGGKDPGAPGKTSSTSEKHIVLSISKMLGEKIKARYPDVKVVYTRSSDVFVELKERVNIAKRNKADLFISIHCNSNNSSQPYGASVHILGPKSKNRNNQKDYFAASMSVAQRENSVMLLEDDYKTSYQDFNPESAESVISNSLLWSANYGNSLMFAAELDGAFRKSPFRVSGYTGIHQDIFYLLWATNMPSVLLELGFISNASDFKYLSTKDGQSKVADRLFDAFSNYKTGFDASMNVESSETVVPSGDEDSGISPASEVMYGVQIMGLSRRLSSTDPALKGLDVTVIPPVSGGKVYKYVSAVSGSAAEAKSQLAAIRRKFPEAFVVRIENNNVTRVR